MSSVLISVSLAMVGVLFYGIVGVIVAPRLPSNTARCDRFCFSPRFFISCAHGSTAGELEEEALFYLRSRGIPEAEAKTILVEGFLAEVMEEFGLNELAGAFRARISSWMGT